MISFRLFTVIFELYIVFNVVSPCPDGSKPIKPELTCTSFDVDKVCETWQFSAKSEVHPFNLIQTHSDSKCIHYKTVLPLTYFVNSSISNCSNVITADIVMSDKSGINSTKRLTRIFPTDNGNYCLRSVMVDNDYEADPTFRSAVRKETTETDIEDYDMEPTESIMKDGNFTIATNSTNGNNSYSMELPYNQTKYMELIVVYDDKLFHDYFRSNVDEIFKFNTDHVRKLNLYFSEIGIQIILKDFVIWNDTHVRNQIGQSKNISEILTIFQNYSSSVLFPKYSFDAAMLVTGEQVPLKSRINDNDI